MARHVERIHVYLGGDSAERRAVAALIERAGRRVCFVEDEDLAAALPELEVLVVGRAPRLDWSPARRLGLVSFLGSGTDGMWPAVGLAPEVVVASARGIHALEMRDHALSLMLAFARELPRALAQQGERRWEPFPAGTLSGRTLVLVGLGEVGRPLAAAAAALGMRVIGVRARPAPVPGASEVLGPEDLGRALREADYLVLALPLTARTRGMIGAEELALLPPGAVLVQMSRGGMIDEPALDAALRAGRLRGAALDVLAEEPLPPSSPLWSTPNLILTPHIAGWMEGYLERATGVFLENLALFEQGLPVRTPVDRDREY
jgi:phosphoglycerate dehydrogenase-like enzyme